MNAKLADYANLVAERKGCDKCSPSGLTNPARVLCGDLDSEHVGPWSIWNGDLDARLVVVGQEWGDIASFVRQRGVDTKSPTNEMLRELLAYAGTPVPPLPSSNSSSGVFLTNAALCLKVGGAQAEVKKEWFQNCGTQFLRRQIELIEPLVVVSLGEHSYMALRHAFNLPRASFRTAANKKTSIHLSGKTHLVPVYHCGQRILNTHRKRDAQFEDWKLVKQLLAKQESEA
jgi:uracil-DNA glycosylase family 4